MAEVQAFKDFNDVEKVYNLLKKWNKVREAELTYIGCLVGLRIGDLLKLKFEDFGQKHLRIIEEKTKNTKKTKRVIKINDNVRASVKRLQEHYTKSNPWLEQIYLFQTSDIRIKVIKPISDSYYRRHLKEATRTLKIEGNYSSHSLRKTFGFQTYMNSNKDIGHVMDLLQHTSESQTKKYIGITQETRDKAYDDIDPGF